MKLKVCGLKDPKNIQEIANLKPDYIGFIFYGKSKRYIADNLTDEVLEQLPPVVYKVGVFVNEDLDNIIDRYYRLKLDYVQLHGDEGNMYCAKLVVKKIPVIKAFSVGDDFNFQKLDKYAPFCDYFLFDTKSNLRGGSGLKFNWEVLKAYNLRTPFFLSGGIGPDDLESISKLSLPRLHAIDINSKFEIEPGKKDTEKVNEFYTRLKQLNQPISC